MTPKDHNLDFTINEGTNHIELRHKETGMCEGIICCPKCLPALERTIKKFRKIMIKRKIFKGARV